MTGYVKTKDGAFVEYPYGSAELQRDNPEANYDYFCDFASIFPSTSTFAPTSSITAGLPFTVGKTDASAGRPTPRTIPLTVFDIAITAPVLPADTTPFAVPSCIKRHATRIELSFFVRNAFPALSSIVTTSLAWCRRIGSFSHPE